MTRAFKRVRSDNGKYYERARKPEKKEKVHGKVNIRSNTRKEDRTNKTQKLGKSKDKSYAE